MKNATARICIIISLSISSVVEAQPGDPPTPNENVPIGGIEVLLLSGGLLGIKKLMARRKND